MDVKKIPGFRRGSVYYTCASTSGFFFRINRTKNNKKFLKCIQKNCSATASCDNEECFFLKITGEHNHLPDKPLEEALVLKNSLVEQAASTSNDLKSIFVQQSAASNVQAAGKIAYPAVSQTMRRERKKNIPTLPNSLIEFGTTCFENRRFGSIDDKPFCRGVTGEGSNASVLFISEELKSMLSEAKEICIDGTFKIRPRTPESRQLLTILVIQYGIAFPCGFALMSSRTVSAYNAVFLAILEIVPNCKPMLIMSDYEIALNRSLREIYPTAMLTGCYFHYCQTVIRNTMSMGMKPLLTRNLIARKALRFLLCLPLLPANKFPEGIRYIINFLEEHNLREDFAMLMRYHDRQWMQRVGANCISVFERYRRTNNDCESFNATLQRYIRTRGPNVWEFTDCLRQITATIIRELRSFIDEGLQIRVVEKRKYRLNRKRIQDATAQFNRDGNVGSFLTCVSYTVERAIQNSIASNIDEIPDDEPLLGQLYEDVPAEFRINVNQNTDYDDEASSSENGESSIATEAPVAEETPVTASLPPRPYLQLGLNYDPADEEVFHLPEDLYEPIPLEAFESDQEADAVDNPFKGDYYDEEMDDSLSPEEACRICYGRRKRYCLVNCGHLLCGYCATQAYHPLQLFSRCPICRTSIITSPLKIFIS